MWIPYSLRRTLKLPPAHRRKYINGRVLDISGFTNEKSIPQFDERTLARLKEYVLANPGTPLARMMIPYLKDDFRSFVFELRDYVETIVFHSVVDLLRFFEFSNLKMTSSEG